VNACPTNYTVARRSGSSDTDSRDCTACVCKQTPCSGGSVHIYSNANCMGGKDDIIGATGTCAALAMANFGGMGALAYTSAPATGGCSITGGTASTPSGTLTFAGETTICCKN
jgi:hypothetical protein